MGSHTPVRVDATAHMCSSGCGCPHEEWDYRLATIAMHKDEGEQVTTLVMLDEAHEEVLPESATFADALANACAWIDAARDAAIQHNNTDLVPARRADEHGDAHE